ncbi:DUF1801 domain-containing protein [Nesterenkonia sp. PF2B19]|uniref:DUF1801 domain-containing protein n=1 Tax=Nesterenkonia sp. PF2B19 TaxID=1881858 RepID=UPI000872838F|nr:DUF1801 domain-containing protein [Nesterenkonia sp. PF2B19]
MTDKNTKNREKVLSRISAMDEPRRSVMRRLHDLILEAAPDLKPRIWYGMPGYASSASSPVLVFIRNDELISLGVSEKAGPVPAGEGEGRLRPSAWFVEELDDVTERRVAEIVRAAVA